MVPWAVGRLAVPPVFKVVDIDGVPVVVPVSIATQYETVSHRFVQF